MEPKSENPEQKNGNKWEIHITCIGGRVEVSSNIKDIILGKGLCEFAKDILSASILKQQQPKIQKPGGIMNFARRR